MTFRGYRDTDFEALYALDEECFPVEFRFSRALMKRSVEARNARVVIAEEAGKLIGFCVAQMEQMEGVLLSYAVTLDVALPKRRRGIAAQLMNNVEAQCCDAGSTAMLLHVFTGNEEAIRFYERNGYMRQGSAEYFYGRDANGAALNAWIYRKELASNHRA